MEFLCSVVKDSIEVVNMRCCSSSLENSLTCYTFQFERRPLLLLRQTRTKEFAENYSVNLQILKNLWVRTATFNLRDVGKQGFAFFRIIKL